MPRLPDMPIKGEPIPAEWGIDVVRFLRSLVVGGDNKRIHTSWDSGGQSISWQPPEPKLEDYFGYWKSENEFGVSSDTFVIRAGRVFGYYGSVDIVETETVITAVRDFWVRVTMPHDDATFAAVLQSGTYPGLRTGGPPQNQINILIGQILEPTTGNFQWTQKWKGSIFIPTLFWPGEHPGFINLSQDLAHLLKLEYVATDFDLKVTNEKTRHLKGLLSQIVSTSTLHIDLTPADDSITGEMLNPDVAGEGLVQDASGNLDINIDADSTFRTVVCIDQDPTTKDVTTLKANIGLAIVNDKVVFTQDPEPPGQTTSVILWLDANQLAVQGDDTDLTLNEDFSGNNNDHSQATAANKGHYRTNAQNGLPAVELDKAGPQFYSADTAVYKFLNDGSNWTTHYVFKVFDLDALYALWDSGGSGTNQTGYFASTDTDGRFSICVSRGVGGSRAMELDAFGVITANTWVVISARFTSGKTGDDGEIFVNGTLQGSNEPDNPFNNAGPSGPTRLGQDRNGTSSFNGQMGETIFLDIAQPDADFSNMINGLKVKWGI